MRALFCPVAGPGRRGADAHDSAGAAHPRLHPNERHQRRGRGVCGIAGRHPHCGGQGAERGGNQQGASFSYSRVFGPLVKLCIIEGYVGC